MNCDEFRDRLKTVDDLQEIEQCGECHDHLQTCSSCQTCISFEQKLREGFHVMAQHPAPPELTERVLAIPATGKKTGKGLGNWLTWGLSLAAAGGFAFFLVFRPHQLPSTSPTQDKAVFLDQRAKESMEGRQAPPAADFTLAAAPTPTVTAAGAAEAGAGAATEPPEAERPVLQPPPAAPAAEPMQVALAPREKNEIAFSVADPETSEEADSSTHLDQGLSEAAIQAPSVPLKDSGRFDLAKADIPVPGDTVLVIPQAAVERKAVKETFMAPPPERSQAKPAGSADSLPLSDSFTEATEAESEDSFPRVVAPPLVSRPPRAPSPDAEKAKKLSANRMEVARLVSPPPPPPPSAHPASRNGLREELPSLGGSIHTKMDSFDEPPEEQVLMKAAEKPAAQLAMRATKSTAAAFRDAGIPRDERHRKLEALLGQNPTDVREGPLDINAWVVDGVISVKERIALAPNPDFRWVARKQGGNWIVFLSPLP
jgi:hypothetical protein